MSDVDVDDTLGAILRAAFGPGNEDMIKWADLPAAQAVLDQHRDEAPECICPKSGIRHGGHFVRGDF